MDGETLQFEQPVMLIKLSEDVSFSKISRTHLGDGNKLRNADGNLIELSAGQRNAWESNSTSDEGEKSDDGLHFADWFKYGKLCLELMSD